MVTRKADIQGRLPSLLGESWGPAMRSGLALGLALALATPGFAQTARTKAQTRATKVVRGTDAGAAGAKNRSLATSGTKSLVTLDFRGANIDNILNFFSVVSGLSIVKDPGLTGNATLMSPRPIPLQDAFDILKAYVESRGFNMERTTNMIRITPRGGGQPNAGPRGRNQNENEMPEAPNVPAGPAAEPRVYALRYGSASAIAQIIDRVFQPTEAQRQQMRAAGNNPRARGGRGGAPAFNEVRVAADDLTNSIVVVASDSQAESIEAMIEQLDVPTPASKPPAVLKVEHVNAADLAPLITSVLAPSPMGGDRGRGRGMPAGEAKIAADDVTNSLVVVANESQLSQVKAILKELDVETRPAREPVVYKLRYVDATELVPVVTSVLNSTSISTAAMANRQPGGQPGRGQQMPYWMSRFGTANRGGQTTSANGLVTAHMETNTLVVTADPTQQALVADVIKEMDVPLAPNNSTMVYNVTNAAAPDIANLLTSMFGRRTGTGGFGAFGTNNNRFGLNNNRFGLNNNRGGFGNNRGGFGNNRGGFGNNRGGFGNFGGSTFPGAFGGTTMRR